MADKILHDVLVADAAVTALVGSRVSPLIKSQGVTPPAVTLERSQVDPQNHLQGWASLDYVQVEVRSWAQTFDQARQVADACRSAIESAGHLLANEFDNYDPAIDPGLYCVTQQFQVWK